MGYWITLLVFSIIGHNHGHNTWRSTVRDGEFLAPGTGATTAPQMTHAQPQQPQYTGATNAGSTYPPSQGYPAQGPPAGAHQPGVAQV